MRPPASRKTKAPAGRRGRGPAQPGVGPDGRMHKRRARSVVGAAAPARAKRRLDIRHFDRQPPPERGPRLNEQIRISPVRLIGADGEQLGLVPTAQALERAREAGLDLVEMAADERPPVCKLIDYGKMRFEASQKQSKNK